MPLISLQSVAVGFGGPLLLDQVDLNIERGERICIVGRNGIGKSTLLGVIAGELAADAGRVCRENGVRVARLAQEVPQAETREVFDVIAAGMGELGTLLTDYQHVSHAQPVDTESLAALHARIDAAQGWTWGRTVTQALDRLDLTPSASFAKLSGGMKRRVLLEQTLLGAPDVLLLDEPTNHLDLVAIQTLEQMVREFAGAVVFVSHDRAFLRALATRIVEIDRGALTSWPGDYANYLRRRDDRAHAETQQNALFDKRLAEEEAWIRQGIKARRTRNEGRVRALESMRRRRAARREPSAQARLRVADAANSGRRVVETRGIGISLGGRCLVRDFSTTILRGDRIGIIGPNGSGKTTLLRLLLGESKPDSGSVELGTQLQIAYFDQHRAQLREDWSALDNVSEGREFIEVGATRKHALGYLQDFLFSPERARGPISMLSGGERNRLLLAKLFARPSNVLVMDEPTNDLDIETLELLEEQLAGYAGTLLLVSHDRAFLDAVVTSTLILQGNGRIAEYVGGFSDWERQSGTSADVAWVQKKTTLRLNPASGPVRDQPKVPTAQAPTRRKLSFKEQRELEQLPARIEVLESEQAELSAQMHSTDFFRREAAAISAANARLAHLAQELEAAFARWEQLEADASGR